MAILPRDDDTRDVLWERIAYLEQANRWYGFALDLLADVGDLYGDSGRSRDPIVLLERTIDQLKRVVDLEAAALLLVSEENSSFELVACEPPECTARMQQDVDTFIRRGEFAWAINQNRALTVESQYDGRFQLLNVIATRNRVRGMFVGLLRRPETVTEANRKLISIILNSCAYALESAALYRMVRDQNQHLENTVLRRTRELEYQYSHDTLTGLLNRLVFTARLEQAIASAARSQRRVVVLTVDLDIFKRVNDSFGHAVGDELLKQVANRLQAYVYRESVYKRLGISETDVSLARLGGDEFGVLLTGVTEIEPVVTLVHGLTKKMNAGFMLRGMDVYVTVSIGISAYPEDGRDAQTLLKHADVALSHTKRDGRNTYHFFAEEMNAWNTRRLYLESRLRQAVRDGDFHVYYQPKVDLISGRVTGAEALLRLIDDNSDQMIPPMEFIPVAETTGLILPIGEWVIRTVCAQIGQWRERGGDGFTVSVNLSARQLVQQDLVENIAKITREAGIPPAVVELELTETAITSNMERAAATLGALHELGFGIAVDDFGIGYSSLLLLKRFPVDTLKIDRSFVRDITSDHHDAAIVTAVVAMAKSLSLRVVAEGVETAEQLNVLKALGCDEVQGFHVGYPVPVHEFDALYQA